MPLDPVSLGMFSQMFQQQSSGPFWLFLQSEVARTLNYFEAIWTLG